MTILSMRRINNGTMISRNNVLQEFGMDPDGFNARVLMEKWVRDIPPSEIFIPGAYETVKEFVEAAKSMVGIEGYVIRMKDGEHVKIKTDWYCALHHTKDSVSAPRRLFECIINEGVDDLKGMFSEDIVTIQRIVDMETKVVRIFNRIIVDVEGFYEANKHLDRKGYAVLANSQADGLMSLKMNLFLGRENNYKEFALKHIEMFDINATEIYETVEE